MGSIFSPSEDGWSRDSECCALSSVCLFGVFCCLCFPSPLHHPPRLRSLPLLFREEALSSWSSGHNSSPPPAAALCSQKSWDSIRSLAVFNSLLESTPDPPSHARLLACSVRESGAWLDVLPSSSLCLHMDDNTVRVAIGLRLGFPLCFPTPVDLVVMK